MFNQDLILEMFFFLLGSIFGSFANVVIYRLPAGQSLLFPRSHCLKCQKLIPWYHNIPIVAWLRLKGKCANCGESFSWRYPLVEFLMASLFCGAYILVGWNWTLVEYLIFIFGLVTVSFIDLDHMILPDVFTLGGSAVALLGAWLNPERNFLDSLFGFLLGGCFLWTIASFYQRVRKEEGMGGGDIKLIAWIGATLGWKAIPFVIISSSLVGSLVGLFVAVILKKGLRVAIPFGPYLALGGVLYIFGGDVIGQWYLHLFIPGLD